MADSVELVTAYMTIVPSMQGAESSITSTLVPAATSGGAAAGAAGGTAMRTTLLAALGPAAIGAAVAGAFVGLYKVGEVFDDVADTIRTGTGATGEALDSLVASAQNVGTTVPAEFSAVGTTIADVNTRLGLTGATLETVASQYLEAGRILGEDVDIQATSAAFNAFGIEGEGASAALDTLFQISQATGVSMNSLASTVSSNAPAVQALGFTFEETAALAGTLDKAGLNSSQTFSALSRGLVNLAKDGEEPAEAFTRVVDEIGAFIEAGDTAAAIDLAGEVFGTRGATQLVGAIESGTLALDDLVATAGATGDTILGVGAETQDFAETWQIVKNNALAALEPLGSAVFSGIGDALAGALPYLQSFAGWLNENQWVLGVVAGVIGVGLVLAFVSLASAVWTATVAMLANPLTWMVLGVMALIAGLVLLIANWDTVVAFLKDVWGGIVTWLGETWETITAALTTAWNAVSTFFTGLWATITGGISSAWNGVVTFLAGVWTSITRAVTNRWNAIVTFVTGIPGRILGGLRAIANLASTVGGWFESVRQAAVDKLNSLISWVGGIPGRILSALGDMGDLLYNAGAQILTGFLNGLKSGWDNVTGWVGGIGSWIADNKGPKSYDLALLRPAGRWIMTGLRDGLEDEQDNLGRTLQGVSDAIAGQRFTAPHGSAGLGSGSGSAAGAGSTFNVYPQPHQSEGEIAQAMANRLRFEMAG